MTARTFSGENVSTKGSIELIFRPRFPHMRCPGTAGAAGKRPEIGGDTADSARRSNACGMKVASAA